MRGVGGMQQLDWYMQHI